MAHDAVKNGNLDALMLMGDVLTILNETDENVMHTAARFGQLPILEYLLKTYPELLLTTDSKNGNNILHYAVESRFLPIVTKLVPLCDDLIDIRNTRSRTPLQLAVEMGFWEAAAVMISQKPTSMDQIDGCRQTIMHGAVFSNNVATVRYLLTACPPGMLQSKDQWGRTPIFCACQRTSLDIVKLLVEADPTTILISDISDVLPVFQVSNVEIMTYLIQAFPHVIGQKISDRKGNLLYYSCVRHDTEMTKLLLSMCPSLLDEVTVDGDSAICVAFRLTRYEHVKTILRFKPDLVVGDDENKNTVLHIAVKTGDYDVVLAVFEHCPANLYCENTSHQTPFLLAVEAKHRAVVEMFQPHVTFDMAHTTHEQCLKNCNIDLFAYAMKQFSELNNLVLPDIANIVFEYLSGVKKRKRDTT